MLALGNSEIDAMQPLGDTIMCPGCGEPHPIEYGETVHAGGTRTPSKLLAFYKCGEHVYLAGIKGRQLPVRNGSL